MTIKKSKGFTIIELLVVFVIIAVLVGSLSVIVTGYINQVKNATIKGNLATVIINAATYYDINSNYGTVAATGFCASTYFTGPSTAIAAIGNTAICIYNVPTLAVSTPATAWCACSNMKVTSTEPAGTVFCVDSTGNKKTSLSICTTACSQATLAVCQ